MPRQEVAILKKWLKIEDCGSLREDFYTGFKAGNCGFGALAWWFLIRFVQESKEDKNEMQL